MTTKVAFHGQWSEEIGNVQNVKLRLLSYHLNHMQTDSIHSSVLIVTELAVLLDLTAQTVVHDPADLWYKVLGPVQVVEKKLLNFLLNPRETDLSTAMNVSKLLALHVKSVVGK